MYNTNRELIPLEKEMGTDYNYAEPSIGRERSTNENLFPYEQLNNTLKELLHSVKRNPNNLILRYPINLTTDVIKLPETIRQVAIINPMAGTIKLSFNSDVQTDRYEVIVNAQKQYVTVPIECQNLSYLREGHTLTILTPTLYAYTNAVLTPVVQSIT